jgi:hypothetical protein
MHEFFQQAKENLLFVLVQRLHQAAIQHVYGRDQLFQQDHALGCEMEHAKTPAFHGHHPLHEPAFFQPHSEIRGR